tara:strand:- start:638 stop:1087 length:450 start_codon:yes stop_codon:yes gene_type:complete
MAMVDLCKSKWKEWCDATFVKVSLEDMFNHKMVLALNGNSYSGIFMGALASKSVPLKQEGIPQSWFEPFLEAWVDYIPISYDLHDLPFVVQWVREHDEQARRIAMSSHERMKALLHPDNVRCHTLAAFAVLLEQNIHSLHDSNGTKGFE